VREFQWFSARNIPLTKIHSGTWIRYGARPGALSRERRASPPKYRAGTVSPLTTATQREIQAQQVCSPLVGLREHDREIASGMQAMTPMMLVIEVKSARNPKASGP